MTRALFHINCALRLSQMRREDLYEARWFAAAIALGALVVFGVAMLGRG